MTQKFYDLHFHNIPVKSASRDAYVDVDVTGECFESKPM